MKPNYFTLRRFAAIVFFSAFTQAAFCQAEIYRAAKENNSEIFLITADSVKHTGTKIKFFGADFAPPFIKVDDVKYSRRTDGFLAYQTEDAYSVSIPHMGDAARYLKGKINLYLCATSVEEGPVFDTEHRWCLEKEKGEYKIATYENLESLFGDNPAVMAKYREFFPDIKDKTAYFSFNRKKDARDHLIELVKMYNN